MDLHGTLQEAGHNVICACAASTWSSQPGLLDISVFVRYLMGMQLRESQAQADLLYLEGAAKSLLNSPASTGMGFWSINPYVGCAFACSYCYAPYAHRYVVERTLAASPNEAVRARLQDLPPAVAFSRRIVVKHNAAAVLRDELAPGRAKRLALERGETLVIGTATDPYQPAERRYRVTRSILESLTALRALHLCIITKSPLIARDAELLAQLARRGHVTVHLSLITVDRALARRLEPRAPTPESRLRALRRLSEAGVDVGVNLMPVLPGITDSPSGIEAVVRAVAAAGARYVNTCTLRLQAQARERYFPMLAREFPQLQQRYARAYAGGKAINENYQQGLKRFVRRVCDRVGIRYGSPPDDPVSEEATAAASARQLELAF
jgi:DNA repair photolyase